MNFSFAGDFIGDGRCFHGKPPLHHRGMKFIDQKFFAPAMSKRGKGKNPDYSVPLLDPRERGVTSPGIRSKYHGTLHDGTELDVIVKTIPDDDQANIALYKSGKKSPHKYMF